MKVIKNFKFEMVGYSILLVLLIVSSLISCDIRYSFGNFITEGNIEYQIDSLSKTARISEVILYPENKNIEIVVPEQINDGIDVVGIGLVTKGEEFLSFSLSGNKIIKLSGKDVEANLNSKVTDYYVTIEFDENIKEADSMINIQTQVYKIDESEEYIRINLEFQVSSHNEYYYSKDGILYKKY